MKQFLAKLIAKYTVFSYGTKPSRIDKFVAIHYCALYRSKHNHTSTDGIHYCKDCGIALHAETGEALGEWRTHLYVGTYG